MKLTRIISIALALIIAFPAMDVPVYASTYDSATQTAFDAVDDAGMGETSYAIRFGSTLQKELSYSSTLGVFIFAAGLKVIGNLSGSSLVVDRAANIGGSLTATGNILTKNTLSGRTLIVSGVASFSGAAVFKNGVTLKNGGVLSGKTLRVSENADVHGALAVTGAIRTDSNFTLNDDADTNNAVLTFGSDTTNEALTWFNTADRFQFSDDVSVVGLLSGSSLRVDGLAAVHGAFSASGTIRTDNDLYLNDDIDSNNVNLTFGSDTTNESLTWFNTADRFQFSDDVSIVGAISGSSLRVDGLAAVHGAFSASGTIRTDNDLTLNDDQTAADVTFTFGSDGTNETLTWFNTADRFKFSDDLDVIGTISGTTLRSWGGAANTFSGAVVTETSFSGASFFGSGLGSCSNGTTDKLLYNPTTGRFSCGTDQTGGGSSGGGMTYAQAEGMFVNQGGDTMTGTLTINATSADIVKSTTGTSGATDFSVAGSTLLNVQSQDDTLTIAEGTVPSSGQGTMSTSTTVTSAAAGAGSHTIIRDDGKYVIILGNASTTVNIWDGIAGGTITAGTATNAAVGAGGMSLRRSDGRYLVIHGGGATTSTLYDPWNITTAAGPTLTSCTATTGTNAFLALSGSYIIMCGGSGNWGIYNGTSNVYTAQTALGANFGAGAHAIQRDDGTFLVFAGGNTTTHWLYNPHSNLWKINPITSNVPTITTGAFSIRRPDGTFLILPGAVNTSYIYDPRPTSSAEGAGTFTAQTVSAGFGPTVALADGAQAIWRQDGKYLLLIGGATTTNIIDVTRTDANQFTTGPALSSTIGAGAHAFIRTDGKVQIIHGGASTTTSTYDMGYVIGGPSTSTGAIYETECITAPMLGTGSRMEWSVNAEAASLTFQVRTGNGGCSGSYRNIAYNGDLVYPTPGHNRVQMRVIFKRPLPKFADQEWGLRRGLSQVRYRRTNKDPTLFDVMIRNTVLLHRTQFEFGGSTDASGPIAVNIQNDRGKSLQIALATMATYGTTYNATNVGFYNGAIGQHPNLTTAASIGTIVMRRPDRKYIILPGAAAGGAGAAMIYDANTFTINTQTAAPSTRTSTGALAFKRPDGKFFIVHGGGTRTTTIYDPVADTYTAGPLMTQIVAEGAQPIPLPNGNVLIMHGGFRRTTTIYNPFANTTMSGALTAQVIGRGSLVIPRPNGQYLVVPGSSSHACALQTATMLYDPYVGTFVNNAGVSSTGTGPGAVAFERSDGTWMIIRGGATANSCVSVLPTNIYSPVNNRMIVGPSLITTGTRFGGQVLPRPDGSWLITAGGGATNTNIYYERAGAFTTDLGTNYGVGIFIAGPASPSATGTGAVAFQRDDGAFAIIAGANAAGSAGTTTVMRYDAGWVTSGFYRSEHINIPNLDSTATLSWKASPSYAGISAEVRTGTSSLSLQKNSSHEVPRSGGPINPTAGDTWLQVTFNLARTIPSYPGIYQDVWWGGGSSILYSQRAIPTPTISEFWVGRDTNLVDLKADGTSLFRVSSNGDIYTGNKGSVNTGGADLAERYTSADGLEPGEVVSFDFTDSHSVRRSTSAYQPEVMGVVSTSPGFVAGAFTKGSYPIALVGRVPVKISLEGGAIHPGDRLVAASMPGYAMKASRAGRSVGVALEALNMDKTEPCKQDPKKQCGTVLMFVNLSDYPGPPK